MSSIAEIETYLVQLPTRREHKWTGLNEPIGRYILVKMTDTEGNVGWGESPALKDWGGEFGRYFGESSSIVRLVIESYLKPAAIGLEVGNIGRLHQKMDAVIKGYPYAKAAMDFAAYDLAGRALGVPVHLLLGGKVRDKIPVTHSIGLISAEEAEKEVKQVVKEGIKTIKIKIGGDPKRDIGIVECIRSAVGPDIDLCVDANEGYATPGMAVSVVNEIAKLNIKYVEQPVMGIDRIAEVAKRIPMPVMADESAWNSHDVINISERRAAQIVSIYTTKPGGLYRALEVGNTAAAAGIICNVNGSIETGVGNLANVQLAAASPSVTLSCVIPVSTRKEDRGDRVAGIYYTDDLLKSSFSYEDGYIHVPDAPGMGIEIDEQKLAEYRVQD